jgi:hypothetical protein
MISSFQAFAFECNLYRYIKQEAREARRSSSGRGVRMSEAGASFSTEFNPKRPPGPGVRMPRSSMKKVSSIGSADFGGGIWPDGVSGRGNKVAPDGPPPMTGPGAGPPPGRPRRRTTARNAAAQMWSGAAAAVDAANAFFVPPPPAADGAAARPRRRGGGSNQVSPGDAVTPAPRPGTAPSGAGSAAGGVPAPLPVPEGTPVRPRRRAAMIGMAAIQAAAKFKKNMIGGSSQIGPTSDGGGGLVPPPPAAARPGRPVRNKSRAALLAAAGLARMQDAAAAGGPEDVAAGAVPPPPASVSRPRSGAAPAPHMSDNFTGVAPNNQQTPNTPPRVAEHDAQTRLAMLASVSRALQRARPGAGRSRRPGAGPFDVQRRKQMVSAVVSHSQAMLAPRLDGQGEVQVMTHYVPEPILRVVTRIQRMWRRKMLTRQRERVRAARIMQSHFRGKLARQKVGLCTLNQVDP